MATIATHNLAKLSPPLRYDCSPAPSIHLTPLSWTKAVTAQQFISHLEASKQDKRGGGGGGKGKKKKSAIATAAAPTAAADDSDTLAAALSK